MVSTPRSRLQAPSPVPVQQFFSRFQRRVPSQALIVFTRQLSSMLKSGIALADSLALIATVSEDPRIVRALRDVSRQIQAGSSLTDSLRRHPLVFSESYVAMVAAGEEAGRLDEILERLAGSLEKIEKTRKQILGAATGPIITGTLTLLIVLALTIFVVPTFEKIYAQARVSLPLITQIILGASQLIRSPFAPLLALGLWWGGRTGFRYVRRDPLVRYQIDWFLLRLPVVGSFWAKSITASMLRVLATMLDSGIPLTDALAITQETVSNRPYRQALRDARAQVAIGGSLSKALERHPVIPPLFCRLLAVGEQSGDLFSMLNRAAGIFEDELELATKALSQAIEPLMTVVLSSVVGLVLIGLYLPLFNLGSTLLKLQTGN